MKVLVVGGTLFFGKRIVRKLLQQGHQVAIFTRGNSRPEFWDQVEPILGDREDYEDFRRKLSGRKFDAVIDNIAYDGDDVRSAIATFDANIGHYILCSSGAVYHQHRDFRNWRPFYEGDENLTRVGKSAYAAGKRQAELALWSMPERDRPFPFTIIRPTVVEGPDDPSGRTWFWVQRVLDGQEILVPQTNPVTFFRHVFSENVAQAFASAVANEQSFFKAYNLAGEEIVTLEEYVRTIAQILGHEAKTVSAPLGEVQKQPSLSGFQPPFVGERFILDISRAKRDLDYRPTPLMDWLKETVLWFRDSHSAGDSQGYSNRSAEVAAARQLSS